MPQKLSRSNSRMTSQQQKSAYDQEFICTIGYMSSLNQKGIQSTETPIFLAAEVASRLKEFGITVSNAGPVIPGKKALYHLSCKDMMDQWKNEEEQNRRHIQSILRGEFS